MKTSRWTAFAAFATAFVAAAGLLTVAPRTSAAVAAGDNSSTIADLQAAFNGESNASARYAAFAVKADGEGYGAVASLFRAASRAETIHAENHAKVLRALGAEPKAKLETTAPGTTRENLAAAIKGETYERDTMYPEFIARARTNGLKDAVQSLNWARTAEAEHAKFYAAALESLDAKKGPGTTYYVCTVCGYTTTNLDFAKCLGCFNPKDKYVAIT
jgi:rubrerythrin